MLENVIVAILVMAAVAFTMWLIRGDAKGKGIGGCSCSHAKECPFADRCDEGAAKGEEEDAAGL